MEHNENLKKRKESTPIVSSLELSKLQSVEREQQFIGLGVGMFTGACLNEWFSFPSGGMDTEKGNSCVLKWQAPGTGEQLPFESEWGTIPSDRSMCIKSTTDNSSSTNRLGC